MSSKQFFLSLSVVTVLVSGVLAGLYALVEATRPHGYFAIISVALFLLICIGLYVAGVSALRSSSKYAFTNLVSVSVFGKMVVSMGFLFVYQKIAQPADNWFVGIFLFCYVVYTVFEVWFMSRLATWTADRKPR